tara:strand:+ start:311 stop:1174 length:864 start_codon:yes stop_codon:yes gene_type:complete
MILYHYCSNETLLSILSGKEIWASELSLSNDHLEGTWVREVMSELCDEQKVKEADKVRLLSEFDRVASFIGAAGFCLSEEGDLLSQWRGYASDGTGVSIGFSAEYFEALSKGFREREQSGFKLEKVTYDLAEQKRILSIPLQKMLQLVEKGAFRRPYGGLLIQPTEEEKSQYIGAYKRLSLEFLMLGLGTYSMKNPAFQEEIEWRLISIVTRGLNEVDGDLPAMEYRASADRVIPFRKFPLLSLSIPVIEKIILGPRNITPMPVIKGALSRYGFPDVEVIRSTASYR